VMKRQLLAVTFDASVSSYVREVLWLRGKLEEKAPNVWLRESDT
jgi:hypothetical protein